MWLFSVWVFRPVCIGSPDAHLRHPQDGHSPGLFGVPFVTEESDIEGGRRKVVFSSSRSGLLCVCWLLSASIIYSWCEASKHESVKESHVVRFSRINCENSWFLILYVVYAVTYKVTLYRHLELSYTTSISNIRRVNKVSRTEFEDCNNIACKYTLLIIEVISCLAKILRSFSRWGSWLLGSYRLTYWSWSSWFRSTLRLINLIFFHIWL